MEEVKIFVNRSVTVGTLPPWRGQCASTSSYLILRKVVDICFALLNQFFGVFIECIEVVRSKVKVLSPIPTQPSAVSP